MNRNKEACKERKLKMTNWIKAKMKLLLIYSIKRLLREAIFYNAKNTGIRIKSGTG